MNLKKMVLKLLKEKNSHSENQKLKSFIKFIKLKPFYNDLCGYLSSGPIVVMILQKDNAVLDNRGANGSNESKRSRRRHSLRKKYGISIDKNSVHGSDSIENAKIEIDFFFKD